MTIEDYIDENGVFDGHYKLLRPLSTAGGTADVWLAEDMVTLDTRLSEDDEVVQVEGTGVLVAIKIYRPKNILDVEGEQTFKKEFKTVFNCHHANLLNPTGYAIRENLPYLVMPYCKNGSAEKFVGKMTGKDELWKFLYDVTSGLAYLHSCVPPIIHQDIKPANILIDDKNNFCITDFGISVKTGSHDDCYFDDESSGTVIYMPPERFVDGYKSIPESDIWSLGATVYELITGDVPFGEEGGDMQLKGAKIPEIKAKTSKEIKRLVYACLDENPSKRPTADKIAEIARVKGKKNVLSYTLASFFMLIMVVSFIIWMQLKPRPIDKFTALCNSGDSIVNIEKQNATSKVLIDADTLFVRLEASLHYYEDALKQENGSQDRRDSVKERIRLINRLPSLLKDYVEISDTLDFAKAYDLPLRIKEFERKQEEMSEKIKKKIIEL